MEMNKSLTDYKDPETGQFDMRAFAKDLVGYIRTNARTHPLARLLNKTLADKGLPPALAVSSEAEQCLMFALDSMLSLYPRPIKDIEVARVVAKFISEFLASFDGAGYVVQHGEEMKAARDGGGISPAALVTMPTLGNA